MKCQRLFTLTVAVLLQTTFVMAGNPIKLLKKVGTFIDSAAVKGVDRRYIDAPKEPWQIMLKGNVNQSDLKMAAEDRDEFLSLSAEPRLKTKPSSYAGVWAGYRGYGIGYSVNVGGDKGSYFTFGAMGGAYGVNVRIHNFENSNPNLRFSAEVMGDKEDIIHEKVQLGKPIKCHTVIADGYYLFNGKHFSYAAAYDQSVIQKRSAGSLMAGAMYFYGRTDYAAHRNADIIDLMKGLGAIKLWQASVGMGYAYNWVPAKGLLISVMAMPMLTFVNKMRIYNYSTNIDELWGPYMNSEDNNMDGEAVEQALYPLYRINKLGADTYNGGLAINFDARLSLTYNFGRYFFNAYGQFSNFRYHQEDFHGYLNDWFVNASLGIRL